MGKKILFNKVNLLTENVNNEIPSFIKKVFNTRKHTLGENPIFPESDETTFEEKILKNRFNDLKEKLKKIGIESSNEFEINKIFVESIKKCIKIENENKQALNELAIKTIRDLFNIPNDIIMTGVLGEIGEDNQAKYPSEYEIEFDNTKRIQEVQKEVYKRRVINSLIQGLSTKISEDIKNILPELYDINPALPELYYKIMIINSFLNFINKGSEQSSNAGVVYVDISKDPIRIDAYGMVFPVLLFELSKGVLELFSSHALPDNMEEANYILSKSDFSMAESWDQRLGVPIWELIDKSIPVTKKDKKYDLFYYIINLPVDEFNNTLKEILSNTKEGKNKVDTFINGIEKEFQTDIFNEKLNVKNQEYKDDFLNI